MTKPETLNGNGDKVSWKWIGTTLIIVLLTIGVPLVANVIASKESREIHLRDVESLQRKDAELEKRLDKTEEKFERIWQKLSDIDKKVDRK